MGRAAFVSCAIILVGLASLFVTTEEERLSGVRGWLSLFGWPAFSTTRPHKQNARDYEMQTRSTCDGDRQDRRRLSSADSAAVLSLGCSELCLLKGVLGHDGGGLACVNFDGQGGAALAEQGVAEPCGWELDATTQSRAAEYIRFLSDAAPRFESPSVPSNPRSNASSSAHSFVPSTPLRRSGAEASPLFARGCALVELRDGVTVGRDFARVLHMLRTPVLAASAPQDRDDLTLIPDMYFTRSKGYEHLNGKADQASRKTPWSEKRFRVIFRGSSTGRAPAGPSDLEANPRIRLALHAKAENDKQAALAAFQSQPTSGAGGGDDATSSGSSSDSGTNNDSSGSSSSSGNSTSVHSSSTSSNSSTSSSNGSGNRRRRLMHARGGGKWDVGLSAVVQVSAAVERAVRAQGLVLTPVDVEKQIGFRGVFDVDGNSNSWSGCWWKLRSNAVVLKVSSEYQQWYYPRLEPWRHFVPVAADLSDVDERVAFVLNSSNDQALEAMAKSSTKLVKEIQYSSEAANTRLQLEACFLLGACSPASRARLDNERGRVAAEEADGGDKGAASGDEGLSGVDSERNEDPALVAAFNAALVRGLGALLARDQLLWKAIEHATACSLAPPAASSRS